MLVSNPLVKVVAQRSPAEAGRNMSLGCIANDVLPMTNEKWGAVALQEVM